MQKLLAQACTGFTDCLKNISVPGLKPEFTPTGFVGQLVSVFLPAIFIIAGFIAIIMIIVSGIQFMTSSGNPEAAAAARGRLIFALIGFGLIVLSYLVLQFVNQQFLGTNIV